MFDLQGVEGVLPCNFFSFGKRLHIGFFGDFMIFIMFWAVTYVTNLNFDRKVQMFK